MVVNTYLSEFGIVTLPCGNKLLETSEDNEMFDNWAISSMKSLRGRFYSSIRSGRKDRIGEIIAGYTHARDVAIVRGLDVRNFPKKLRAVN